MKSTMRYLVLIGAMLLLAAATASAQIKPKSTGFGLRGSYWNMHGRSMPVWHVQHGAEYDLMDFGGAGGWLYFFSRTSESWFLEFQFGGIADVIEQRQLPEGEETRVLAVMPVLLGLRHPLLSANNTSALRPYIAFGGGPYWFADILVQDRYNNSDVAVNSTLRPGAYAGGGLDFMLSSHVGLNFDVKYHFIDLNAHHANSGYEYALGLQFCWGDYQPGR